MVRTQLARLPRLPRLPRLAHLLGTVAIVLVTLTLLTAASPMRAESLVSTRLPAWAAMDAGAPVVRGNWLWPLAPPHPVERPFVAPPGPYAAGHRGIDITATVGADVYAVAAGTVYFAGTVVDRGVLSLAHPGELLSTLEPVTALVAEGETVHAGQLIATVATGGHCAARCVHFGVRLAGQYISPLLYLGGIPRAVLLPLGP